MKSLIFLLLLFIFMNLVFAAAGKSLCSSLTSCSVCSGDVCTSCPVNTFLTTQTSPSCDPCSKGTSLPDGNSGSGCCDSTVTNCIDCASDSTKCKTCASGYTLSSDACSKPVIGNTSTASVTNS